MSEWREVRLGDVTSILGDGIHGTPKYSETGEYYFINGSNLCEGEIIIKSDTKRVSEEEYQKYKKNLNDRTLLFSINGTVGNVAKYNGEPCVLGKSACYFNVLDTVDRNYIYYIVSSPSFIKSMSNLANGTTIKNVSLKQMRDKRFLLPPIDEQYSIASILSSLDDKIAVNRRICENLEAQAQALFKHWFIDFAPFKNGKFVESELGMIPEGWRVGRLDEYVDNLSGYSYKGNELQPSTTAMATIKNFVRGGGFKIEGYKEIVISKNIKEYQYVNLFDVLVAHTDLTQNAEVVGNPAIILSTAGYEKLIMSMDLTKVVSKDARITPPLLHSILSTRKFKEHALGYVNGTTVLHMSKKAVPEYKLVMPKNLDTLKELTSVLDNLYYLMSETYAENLRLTTLRDTLLPKLMSGQIKV